MRLVYTADLHGDITSYHSLLHVAAQTDACAAIVGGDLLPRAIRRDTAIATQRSFVEQQLYPLLQDFRAMYPTITVYLLAGNDDWAAAVQALNVLEADALAWPLHEQVYALTSPQAGDDPTGQLWLAGYACVPLTPFSIKDNERMDAGAEPGYSFDMAFTSVDGDVRPLSAAEFAARPALADDLARLAQRSDPARTIYVCHTPPADTPLDVTGRGKHVGSRALRAFIEQHQPPLTLHGHIHESPQMTGQYATRIGRTWCINPGHSEHQFQAVVFDTDDIAGTLEHTILGKQF
jgi:Icc-related predicted phosphoesterase